MVRAVYCVLVALMITASSCQECPSSDDYDADVLIFGAGITGLTVARHLHDNGITSIKVLEARDEIGGRVRSATFAGSLVEVGANWIHEVPSSDRDRQPLWKLTKDSEYCVDLQGHFTGSSEVWLMNEDDEYTEADDTEVSSQYETATGRTEELATQLRNDDEDDITVRQALTRSDWVPTTPLELSVDWANFDFSVAQSPDVSSLFRHNPDIAETGLGTADYFISDQRGFATILNCIADGIESKIQLGAMVNNISWNDDCVCASVTIDSQDQTMCGKYGVVTFSIGVLQDWISSDRFYPTLSDRKQNSINALGMGYYLKIFIQFSETFWNDEVDFIYRGDSRRGYYPVISPLGQLFPGSPSIIIMTVTGSEAVRIANQSINATKDEIMVVLRELYGDSIPDISDILVPTWIGDPLYRGMYSFAKFGSSVDDLVSLKQPEGNRLYFSGEALSVPFIGALHGGYCEGLTTGDEILKANGMDVSTSSLPQCPSGSSITKATVSVTLVISSLLLLLFV